MTLSKHIALIIIPAQVLLLILINTIPLQSIEIINPHPGRADSSQFEINDIILIGDLYYKPSELKDLLYSKPTELSIWHRGVRFLSEQVIKNRVSPVFLRENLANSLTNWLDEFKYFNKESVELDSVLLSNFYFQKGFYDFRCSIKFYGVPNTRRNVLLFQIYSGKRSTFDSVVYIGLDKLPNDVYKKIEQIKKIRQGAPFDEDILIQEVRSVNNLLRESGYFFAQFNTNLPIQVNEENKSNLVIVAFNPGHRQYIGNIRFIDKNNGVNLISQNMKNYLLAINSGDYYSPSALSQSELNLYSLGTFDLVRIDTAAGTSINDSIINLDILLSYRKQNEYGFGLFFNQTTWDAAYNIGVEGRYSNRNVFGAAQVINPYTKATLLDIARSINIWPNFEYEFSAGFNFTQPILWKKSNWTLGFSMQPNYSYRIFNKFLNLETISLPLTANIKLPDFTFFQSMALNLTMERQYPKNYNEAMNKMLNDLTTGSARDTIALLETFSLYNNLNSYVRNNSPWLTTNLIGVSIFGDRRDNPFSPQRGYYANLTLEGLNPLFLPFGSISGIAKFAKIQAIYLKFWKLHSSAILAFKIKAGTLYWWDKTNSYVPTDKQFFAGGANSIRGWNSRRLRFYHPEQFEIPIGGTTVSDFALDYVGNTSLIETSLEWRYRFTSIKGLGEMIREQLSNFGVTFFIDAGNAFQWMTVDSTGNYHYRYSLTDMLTKHAVAAGLGLRYETPVGPIRIDFGWPVYDPLRRNDALIFNRQGGLKTMVFHIGLGNAF